MDISELKSGLIADEDLFTKFGRQVLAKNTKLSPEHIEEIQHLLTDGLISGELKVQVPRGM